MKHNDTQSGSPEIIYKDTKANVEAIAAPVEGMKAYATDTHLEGVYNGTAWKWVGPSALLGNGSSQYQTLITGATPFVPVYSGFLLDGTTGGKTVLAVTSGKVLTLTAVDNINLTVPATGTAALLGTANVFTAGQKINLNSMVAFFVEQDGVHDNTLIVDTTNGKVGIGTSPSFLLDIGATDATTWVPNTTAPLLNFFNLSATANSCALIKLSPTWSDGTGGGVKFGAVSSASYSADFVIANRNAGTYQENMRVTYSGNVGIGTPGPGASLDIHNASDKIGLQVQGFSTQTNNLQEWLSSAPAILSHVNSNGTLDIGIATGTAPLVIASTTAVTNLNADLLDGLHTTDLAIVKQNISITARTTAIGSTNITGTNTAGLYRISYYLEDTTADLTAGTIQVTFGWTDDAGATTSSSVALPLTAVGRTSGMIYVRVLGTGSIQYSTTLVGVIGTSQYALFISCEKLL